MMSPNTFDVVARGYARSVLPIPRSYILLVEKALELGPDTVIIDMGCGPGTLTMPLSRASRKVYGLDCSLAMLRLAQLADSGGRIRWICARVEDFCLPANYFDVIMSFEAFHLFGERDRVLRTWLEAVRPGGYMALGWCVYEWEKCLDEAIRRSFEDVGVAWEGCGYQSCADLPRLIEGEMGNVEYEGVTRKIEIPARSTVSRVVEYLSHIDSAGRLSKRGRERLRAVLKRRVSEIAPSGVIAGESEYFIVFLRDRNEES